ncbi:unnamed protein product [Closterium sp. NIES-54]
MVILCPAPTTDGDCVPCSHHRWAERIRREIGGSRGNEGGEGERERRKRGRRGRGGRGGRGGKGGKGGKGGEEGKEGSGGTWVTDDVAQDHFEQMCTDWIALQRLTCLEEGREERGAENEKQMRSKRIPLQRLTLLVDWGREERQRQRGRGKEVGLILSFNCRDSQRAD